MLGVISIPSMATSTSPRSSFPSAGPSESIPVIYGSDLKSQNRSSGFGPT